MRIRDLGKKHEQWQEIYQGHRLLEKSPKWTLLENKENAMRRKPTVVVYHHVSDAQECHANDKKQWVAFQMSCPGSTTKGSCCFIVPVRLYLSDWGDLDNKSLLLLLKNTFFVLNIFREDQQQVMGYDFHSVHISWVPIWFQAYVRWGLQGQAPDCRL